MSTNRKGLTLIELLVAITLSSFVFIMAGSFMAFVIDRNTKNSKQELFEQVKNDLALDFSNSIKWATHVNITGNGFEADGTVYSLTGDKISKNGQNMIEEGVGIDSFEVKNFSLDPDLKSLQIRVKMKNLASPLSTDQLEMVVSQRKVEVTDE